MEIVKFQETEFRTYEINEEILFDLRDIRDWFGYEKNKDIFRAVSKKHLVPLSMKSGVTAGITDCPPRGMTLITHKGLIQAAMKLEPRNPERKKLIEEFQDWALNVLADVMNYGVYVSDETTKQDLDDYLNFKRCIKLIEEDELTINKYKREVLEKLKEVKYQRRVKMINELIGLINEVKTEDLAKKHSLTVLKTELLNHKIQRQEISKQLCVKRRDNKIKKLENKVEELEWIPDFSIKINYPGISKNAMYEVIKGILVTSKFYKKWKKNFPSELLVAGLKKDFYDKPFEWKISGKIYNKYDPSNLITPVQDQIARSLGNRDDKEIYFQGFIMEEIDFVENWKDSKLIIHFKLL